MNRGDVVLVRFPHPSGVRGKKRPAVVVQSDSYAGLVGTVVVAEVTKNATMRNDPACLFIVVNTPDGRATGLVRDSVVSCLVLVTERAPWGSQRSIIIWTGWKRSSLEAISMI